MPRLPGQTLDAYDGSLALKLLGLRGILLLYNIQYSVFRRRHYTT